MRALIKRYEGAYILERVVSVTFKDGDVVIVFEDDEGGLRADIYDVNSLEGSPIIIV